jgi:hypothetical protein
LDYKKLKVVEKEISRLELEKPNVGKTEKPISQFCPILRDLVDEVGTIIKEQNGHIFIPDFVSKQIIVSV